MRLNLILNLNKITVNKAEIKHISRKISLRISKFLKDIFLQYHRNFFSSDFTYLLQDVFLFF